MGVNFLRGSMCAEGMGCGRRWVRWVLRETGTSSGHPGLLPKCSRGWTDYLPRQVAPKWDSPNAEHVLATAGTKSLLVKLEGVAA